MKPINLIIADDHDIILDGYTSILESEADIQITSRANNGKEVIEALKYKECDVILMDINMPEMNGIETTKILKKTHPKIKIIILSMHTDVNYIRELTELGVESYLLKNSDKKTLLHAIRTVNSGKAYFDAEIKAIVDQGFKSEFTINNEKIVLSPRELEIIQMIAAGLTTNKIADELCLSPHTIHTHRKNINHKLNISNPVELTLFARKHQLMGLA